MKSWISFIFSNYCLSISLVTFSVYSSISNFTTRMASVTKKCEFWEDICVTVCNDSEILQPVKSWHLNEQEKFDILLWQGSRLHSHWIAPHEHKGQTPGQHSHHSRAPEKCRMSPVKSPGASPWKRAPSFHDKEGKTGNGLLTKCPLYFYR